MAKDKFHQIVRAALEKEGWTITHDPYLLKYGNRKIEIDLGAEKLIAAEKGTEQILVEVKSFLSNSIFYEMHNAVGQFGTYRRLLFLKKLDYALFLAVPADVYEALFTDELGLLTQEEKLNIIVYEPEEKSISKWIK